LGIGSLENKSKPVKVGTNYQAISAGSVHSMALKKDGTLWSWGNGEKGQLGHGDISSTSQPVQIKSR